MRNYIILNNQNSNTISGLIIQELAPISKPLQRTQVETIDGRDGDIVTPLGYAAYNKKIKIGLYGNFNINDIIAYFATKGTVIFSNEPDKYYYYQIVDQIDYERLVRYRVATVTMHVQPFKYSATEGTITVDSSDTVSDEGSDIALDGTAEAPFNVLRHKGNATQKTLSGKNKMPMATANMQGSDANTDRQKEFRTNLPIDTYVISFNLDAFTLGSQTSFPINMRLSYENGSALDPAIITIYSSTTTGRKSFVFTTTRVVSADSSLTASNIRIGLSYWNNGARATLSNIQIEAGSTATDYEQYVGGMPSPNPDYPQDINVVTGDSTVKITGKNLFNIDATPTELNHATGTVSGQSITVTTDSSSSPSRVVIPFNYFPDRAMTVSFDATCLVYEPTATNNPIVALRTRGQADGLTIANLDKTIGETVHYSAIITPNNDTRELWLYVRPSGVAGDVSYRFDNIQIEYGSLPSDYESYKEQSYVLPFGDTYLAKIGDYADEPVKVDGTWYIRRAIGKVVLDGTETNWSGELYGGLWRASRIFSDIAPITLSTDFVGMSDYFRKDAGVLSSITIKEGMFCQYRNTSSVYFAAPSSAQTSAEWKSWLSTHNTTVYYVLATPTDEAITDQDLIDALDELYDQAHSYKGHTHITATAADGNAPSVLSVEVGEDNESTVTNAGNTTSRPILTIYGQGDIGVYINDVEVLDVALGDEGYITLDSVEMEAYKDTTANLKNRLVTGDYSKLALNAGDNKIYFTGTVTKYEISKYSRWL